MFYKFDKRQKLEFNGCTVVFLYVVLLFYVDMIDIMFHHRWSSSGESEEVATLGFNRK